MRAMTGNNRHGSDSARGVEAKVSKGKSTSTERLLEIIRGDKAGELQEEPGKELGPAALPARAKGGLAGRGSARKVRVGADLGPYALTLVKMVADNGGFKLLGIHQAPYPSPDMSFKSPEFVSFLRASLAEFCGPARSVEIWTLVSSANADLWHMRVPKVPPRQAPDAVYWAAKKEKQFDDSQFVLDFEIQGKVMDNGVEKLSVMAYVAPRNIVEERRELFVAAGYPLTGATISPIALQTLFRAKWVPNTAKAWANIFVGRNWSRIDVFDRGDLVMSRAIKAGTNSMIEAFLDAYNDRQEALAAAAAKAQAEREAALQAAAAQAPDTSPLSPVLDLPELVFDVPTAEPAPQPDEVSAEPEMPVFELELESDPEEAPAPPAEIPAPAPQPAPGNSDFVLEGDVPPPAGFTARPIDLEQARRLLYHKLLGRSLGQDRTGAELAEAEVFALIEPATERLVRQVERTFDHFVEVLGNDRIERLFFSGDICTNQRLLDYVEAQLGLPGQILDPLAPDIPWLTGKDVPESTADRLNYNLVVALALCDNAYTPNLLYTYKDKESQRRVSLQARVIYSAAGVLLALLAGFYFWNTTIVRARQADLAGLKAQLAGFSPQVDQMLLAQLGAKASGANHDQRDLARRFEGLAVLRELAGLTPENVRLVAVNLEMGPAQQTKEGAKDQTSGRLLVIDGFVTGGEQAFESSLASYLVRLENSPLFGPPLVHKRSEENLGGQGRVLRFVLHVALG
jgi:Tfp pilus assembly PilM family ATPase